MKVFTRQFYHLIMGKANKIGYALQKPGYPCYVKLLLLSKKVEP